MERRNFLKAFGFGTVIVPGLRTDKETVRVEAPTQYVPEYMDVQSAMLYSCLVLPKESEMHSGHSLFALSIGQCGPEGEVQTIAETNMVEACKLPPPQAFAVQRIGLIVSPLVEPRLRSKFISRYALEFQIHQKIYFRAPLSAMFSVAEINSGEKFPETPIKASVDLDIPLALFHDSHFVAHLCGRPINPHGKLKVWAFLQGRHIRAIQ